MRIKKQECPPYRDAVRGTLLLYLLDSEDKGDVENKGDGDDLFRRNERDGHPQLHWIFQVGHEARPAIQADRLRVLLLHRQ